MNTPIVDFVDRYSKSGALRLHMPGHKGSGILGIEHLDITEIAGADSLYEANGIILESEKNAGEIFGANTFYSTEGSSQCIRAMLYLVLVFAKEKGIAPKILAGRNAHKSFLSAAALLGLDIEWLYGEKQESYLSCNITPETLEDALNCGEERPVAVYITSPDYLGNIADIKGLSAVCREYGVLLIVDNAHGAYLKFLPDSKHPIDMGAHICCDSAHKTLPVLTGGAYLHIANSAPESLTLGVKNALALFGSTSPSYLILRSLDAANKYLAEEYREVLLDFTTRVQQLKQKLALAGYKFVGDEPLKLTFSAKDYGYTGTELGNILSQNGVLCEFADPDFLVLMLSPQIGVNGLEKLGDILAAVPKKTALAVKMPIFSASKRVMNHRTAIMAPSETLPIENCVGRVCAATTVGCPPAVPIVACGERIDAHAVDCFKYYGITTCCVVKE